MKSCEKVAQTFICESCYYNTSKTSSWKKHLLTSKHINTINTIKNTITKVAMPYTQICSCGKQYKHSSSLWNHQKKCEFINNKYEQTEKQNNTQYEKYDEKYDEKQEQVHKAELIKQLIIQNQQLLFDNKEFKELIMDQTSKMMELATKPSTINNNNCNNKQFNLNVFLNEKCKNAMNIDDFISSLEIVSEDFEDIGKLGYVQGISNIFIKGLRDLDETVRPMHCTDKKRETLYIKDVEGWNKDNNKDKIKMVIKEIADKNVKYIPIWQEDNPTSSDGTTKKNDQYMRIVNQVMTAIVPDDENGLNKIIKNVANEICIDK